MKICEIDDQDRTFAAAAGIDLDIDTRFEYAEYILNTISQSKSPSRNSNYLPAIEDIESDFVWIINQVFANDASTSELKEKASKYLAKIQQLKARL